MWHCQQTTNSSSSTMRGAISMARQANPLVDLSVTSKRFRADSATSGLLSSHHLRVDHLDDMRRMKVVCSCLDKRSSIHAVHDWLFGKPEECVDCVMPHVRSIRHSLRTIQQQSLGPMFSAIEKTIPNLLEADGLAQLHPTKVQRLLYFLESSGAFLDMMLETQDMIRRQKQYLSLLVDIAQETNADVLGELQQLYSEADSEHTLYMSVNHQRAAVSRLKEVVRQMGLDVPV